MTRIWLILSIGALSLGVAACGDYDEKNAAYDEKNAAYDESNAAYDSGGNAGYEAPADNAAYMPPPDANMTTNNVTGEVPPATTNGY